MSRESAPFRPIPGKTQTIALGAASVQSTAVGAQTYAVYINSTGACHIEIGRNPTASKTTSLYLSANVDGIVLACAPGDIVAVIQDASATGNCYITELTR
jgi:hypothetical protein